MTRKTDAVLEFDDKEHPAWYPRAEVTIELLSDPDDVDLLFRKLGVPRTKHTFERAAESGVLQVKRPPALDGELCVHIESCQIVGILDHFWEPRAVITVIREDGVREAPQQMDAVPCGPSMVSLDSTIKLTMRLQDSIEITLLAKKGFRPNGQDRSIQVRVAQLTLPIASHLSSTCQMVRVNSNFSTVSVLANSSQMFVTMGLRYTQPAKWKSAMGKIRGAMMFKKSC